LLGGGATALATAASFTLLFALVASGRTSLAAAGAALVAVRVLAGRLAQLSSSAASLLESSLFLDDLTDFELGLPAVAVDDRSEAPRLGDIVVEHVSFRYPETDRDALTDVTVRVGIGEVVALVGENGSGKTTLSKIVAQLYEPTEGRMIWNGADALRFTTESRRRQVSVTFQDFVRFALPVEDNISLGRGQLRAEARDVTTAAKLAGADEFVRGLADGYATLLGKEFVGGVDLSVGQWQRLALARAFYRDARLVVLDEPTASLDARAEHALFEVVRDLFVDRAVLLITHRLSSVRNADRIYVLEGGSIAEEGDHESLLANGGLYAELYDLQAAGFAEERVPP
jgi:ATP-binding cassette subfamily B protein